MNDDMQKQFVSWLASKLQAKDENDLKSKMQQLGQDGIKQAYQSFMQEQQQSTQQSGDDETAGVPTQAKGGMLEYIQRLQAFKSGGRMDHSSQSKPAMYGERSDSGRKDHTAVGKNHGIGKTLTRKGNGTRDDKEVQETKPGKKDWMDTGKHKKEHTAVTRVAKSQMGGIATYAQGPQNQNGIQVQKADGTVAKWGNDLPAAPARQYMLHPMQGGLNQISQEQLDHIHSMNPKLAAMLGTGIGVPGQVARFGADQSDMIRKALAQYPMNQQPAPSHMPMASMAKGGKMGAKERIAMNLMKKEKGKKKNYMQDGGDVDYAESGMRFDIERGQMTKSGQKTDGKTSHTSHRMDAAKTDPKSKRHEADKPVIKKDSRKDASRTINHSELVSPTHGKKKPREFQSGGPIGDGANRFKTSKAAKQMTPKKAVMGQGMGTITSR